jgi:hypothetical protein
MPVALILLAIVLIVVGFRGTQSCLFTLLVSDFTGTGNFVYWVVALVVIGAIGYIPKLKGPSDAFIALILVVFFLSNEGVWTQLTSALSGTTTTGSNTGSTVPSLSLPSLTPSGGTDLPSLPVL